MILEISLLQVPYAISNTLMEKNVQDKKITPANQIQEEQEIVQATSNEENIQQEEQVNLVYFTFWWSLFISLTALCLFWVCLIPGFGTAPDFGIFWKR